VHNYDQLSSFCSNVGIDGGTHGSTRSVFRSLNCRKVLQTTGTDVKYSFKHRHLQEDQTKASVFCVSECSTQPQSTGGKKHPTSPPARVNKAITTCVQIFCSWRTSYTNIALYGFRAVVHWSPCMCLSTGRCLHLGTYTLPAAQRATTHPLRSPPVDLVSVSEARLRFSHRRLMTDHDATREAKLQTYLRFSGKAGKGDCSVAGNLSRAQGCCGKYLTGSNLPRWNLRIWAKDKFKQLFLFEEYFLTGHWLETLFSQCLVPKIKHAIYFFLKTGNLCNNMICDPTIARS